MLTLALSGAYAAPAVSTPFASRFQLSAASSAGAVPFPTQMAWGPDNRLYVTRFNNESASFAFDPVTGAISDRRATGVFGGFGIAFANHATPDAPARDYMYVCRNADFHSSIARLSDDNGNGQWGEAGETNVEIVRGVPHGDHTFDQIQVRGGQLFIGMGARTHNGRTGDNTGQGFHDTPDGPVSGGFGGGQFSGFTYGETSYNGAIGTIRNLALVPNVTSAAQLRDGPNGTSGNLLAGRDAFLPSSPHAHLPYTSTAEDKLVVHSAGTRNPYGLALRADGELWFTNNYDRADTNGDGTSTPHFHGLGDADLANDVHDQLFRAVPGGDYRYDNQNFRGTPSFPTNTVVSTTFDNLDSSRPGYLQLHDPANPDGLGPSSSANGFDFGTMDLTGLLASDAREYALISRWSPTVAEEPPGTDAITFQDFVVVDPSTGQVRRLAEGFGNPIDVVNDRNGGFLLLDWGDWTIYRVTPSSTSARWGNALGGDWSDPANWTGPVPSSVGAVANFTGAIGEPRQVNVGQPRLLGTMNFDNANRYTIGGTGTLTIVVAAGHGAVSVVSGSHTIAAPVHLISNTTVNVQQLANTLTMSGDQTAAAGVTLTKAGPGTLAIKHLRADHVVLNAGTTRILPNGSAAGRSNVKSLTLAGGATPTATLDLTNNALVIDHDGASPLALVAAQVEHAHNGGAWNQSGITSSQANASQFAVGYAERAALSSVPAIFGTADATAVLVRLTRYGDADLSGSVNLADFNALAANFGQANRFWYQGDSNYDNVVNLIDFNLLAANFGLSATGTSVTPADWAALASAVPEPSATLLLAPLALLARCRAARFSG